MLDLVYLSRKADDPIFIDIDFSSLDRTRLTEFAARFPASVRTSLAESEAVQGETWRYFQMVKPPSTVRFWPVM